jgi:23S rRNA pseudouridine2457 synthase
MSQLILFNKPYRVLSQFSASGDRPTLARCIDVPDVYPAGRLDYVSEGLLLLTDDGKLQHRISHPRHKLPKTYWAQVEGEADAAALAALRRGVVLNDGPTLPAEVDLLPEPDLWPRHPPIRQRQAKPTHWLAITIGEGRNRQVRRMTAAVGLPTLLLIRIAVGPWRLQSLQRGEWLRLDVSAQAAAARERRPRTAAPRQRRV